MDIYYPKDNAVSHGKVSECTCVGGVGGAWAAAGRPIAID